jgi:hypothetical protein
MGAAVRTSRIQISSCLRGTSSHYFGFAPPRQVEKDGVVQSSVFEARQQEQIVGVLPHARPDLAGVIVNRSRCTFTERDRLMLNILRFHISEACRTAKMIAPPSSPLVEALESVVGGSIVFLNKTGAVKFCSRLAQEYLETFLAWSDLLATVFRSQ